MFGLFKSLLQEIASLRDTIRETNTRWREAFALDHTPEAPQVEHEAMPNGNGAHRKTARAK